jgi:hypothetical protein
MKLLISVGVAAAIALLPVAALAQHAQKPNRPHRVAEPRPVYNPPNDERGNAALGGNNANSASGSNSAGENANGRTGGGFGG